MQKTCPNQASNIKLLHEELKQFLETTTVGLYCLTQIKIQNENHGTTTLGSHDLHYFKLVYIILVVLLTLCVCSSWWIIDSVSTYLLVKYLLYFQTVIIIVLPLKLHCCIIITINTFNHYDVNVNIDTGLIPV